MLTTLEGLREVLIEDTCTTLGQLLAPLSSISLLLGLRLKASTLFCLLRHRSWLAGQAEALSAH